MDNSAQETPLSVVKEQNEECRLLCNRHHLVISLLVKLVFYQLNTCYEVHLCDMKLIFRDWVITPPLMYE